MKKLSREAWLARLTDAQEDERYVGWKDRAHRYQKYYEGAATAPSESESVVVNTVFKDVKMSLPKLFAKNPDVLARAKRPQDRPLAKIAGPLLMYYQEELRLKRTINRCLPDAKLSGMGVVKFGWSFETAEQEISPEVFDQMDGGDQARITQRMLSEGVEHPTQQVILQDEPWILRWNPKDFLVDPDATSPDLSDARWIAFRKVMPVSDAEAAYGTLQVSDPKVRRTRAANPTPDFQRLTCWEIYDKLRQERLLFFEEAESFERREPWEFGVDGFPAETVFFNETPDEPYGHPDVRFYEGQLKELNDIRSQMIAHRRAYNAQTWYEEGSLDDPEVAKAAENVAHTWIRTRPGAITERRIVTRPTPSIPPDVYAVQAQVKSDLAEIIGSENQAGAETRREQTATESAIVESRSKTRDGERQDVVEGLLTRIHVKLWTILRQKLSVGRVQEIVGEPVEWQNVSAEEAKKELDIEIKTNSTLPRMDRQVLITQNIQLLQVLQGALPALAAQGTKLNFQPLLEEILELMNHKINAAQILQPAPLPGVPGVPGVPGGNGGPPNVMGPAQVAESLGAQGGLLS